MIMDSDFWDNVCLLQDRNQLLQCRNRVKKTQKTSERKESRSVMKFVIFCTRVDPCDS